MGFVSTGCLLILASLASTFAQEPAGQLMERRPVKPVSNRRAAAAATKPGPPKSSSAAGVKASPDPALQSTTGAAPVTALTTDERVVEAIEQGDKARNEKSFSEAESQYRRQPSWIW